MACFHIEDEGNGIDEEKLSLIFERFYRADDSRSKQIKGFGLGLSIVQQIVDVHDGIIHVKNRKPKGLEIEVMLPLVS
jgi:signal transduction histidine kinase